jgi:hypothetical protein
LSVRLQSIIFATLPVLLIGTTADTDARECHHTPSWQEAETLFQRSPVGWSAFCYFKPAERLFDETDLRAYRRLLEDGDCRLAQSAISGKFRQTYPEMRRFMPYFFTGDTRSPDVVKWFLVEEEVFTEVSVCATVDEFFRSGSGRAPTAMLDDKTSFDRQFDPDPDIAKLAKRSRQFHRFMSFASRDSDPPSQVRFVRFVLDHGEALELVPRLVHPHMPLFLLGRAGRRLAERPADFDDLVGRASDVAGSAAELILREADRMPWSEYEASYLTRAGSAN